MFGLLGLIANRLDLLGLVANCLFDLLDVDGLLGLFDLRGLLVLFGLPDLLSLYDLTRKRDVPDDL